MGPSNLTNVMGLTPSSFLQLQFFSFIVGLLVHSLDLLGKILIYFKVLSLNHLYCTLLICLLLNYSKNDNANFLNVLKSVYVKIFLILHPLK